MLQEEVNRITGSVGASMIALVLLREVRIVEGRNCQGELR
jgi:hypothetical protein